MYLGISLRMNILITLLFVIIVTTILFYAENKSNISPSIIIPAIVALLTKYILGDWDAGFNWTAIDLLYWASVTGTSYGTVLFLSNKN
jgi:hypothetical protein